MVELYLGIRFLLCLIILYFKKLLLHILIFFASICIYKLFEFLPFLFISNKLYLIMSKLAQDVLNYSK